MSARGNRSSGRTWPGKVTMPTTSTASTAIGSICSSLDESTSKNRSRPALSEIPGCQNDSGTVSPTAKPNASAASEVITASCRPVGIRPTATSGRSISTYLPSDDPRTVRSNVDWATSRRVLGSPSSRVAANTVSEVTRSTPDRFRMTRSISRVLAPGLITTSATAARSRYSP